MKLLLSARLKDIHNGGGQEKDGHDGRLCIDKLRFFHANQITMCLDPHLNKG